jgi:putative ABC transport system substrate-binding protein
VSIGRRDFIRLLGGAAAWPVTARAQPTTMPVVGYLEQGAPDARAHLAEAFRKGLSEAGFVEGRNVAIESRFAGDDVSRLPELAADLVRRRVAAIVTPQSAPAARAAKAATATIPIIVSMGTDPVELGLAASLNRPGGNVTGIYTMATEMDGKRIGLLRQLKPDAATVAVLLDPSSQTAVEIKDLKAAAAAGQPIEVIEASTPQEIDAAFAGLAQRQIGALLVGAIPLYFNRRVQIVGLALFHRIPAIYVTRDFAEAGGLMSYGVVLADVYRQAGIYTGRILKGEKPADLPMMQPTKFELVINLQTARTLGLTVPPTLLAIADEVIE